MYLYITCHMYYIFVVKHGEGSSCSRHIQRMMMQGCLPPTRSRRGTVRRSPWAFGGRVKRVLEGRGFGKFAGHLQPHALRSMCQWVRASLSRASLSCVCARVRPYTHAQTDTRTLWFALSHVLLHKCKCNHTPQQHRATTCSNTPQQPRPTTLSPSALE